MLSTEENIGNSRDCSFEWMIKLRTNGQGVDFVLNSLAEEQLHASIRCLGRSGTFLEIGKFDLANDSKIGNSEFSKMLSNFKTKSNYNDMVDSFRFGSIFERSYVPFGIGR